MADGDLNVVGTTPKPKSKTNWKIIGAGIGVIVLALSIAAGILLINQSQDVREKADTSCPAAEACPVPGEPNVLNNCTPPRTDNSPVEILCLTAGKVELCGGRQYCCPSAGAAWTTNLALCPQTQATAVPTATATVLALPTSTSTASGLATTTPTSIATSLSVSASPTSTSTATAFPVPDTGTSWPSIIGFGLGALVIIFSLGLAL